MSFILNITTDLPTKVEEAKPPSNLTKKSLKRKVNSNNSKMQRTEIPKKVKVNPETDKVEAVVAVESNILAAEENPEIFTKGTRRHPQKKERTESTKPIIRGSNHLMIGKRSEHIYSINSFNDLDINDKLVF